MSPTIETAKKKWALKVKGDKWKRGVTGRGSDYCHGVAEFLGVGTCNPAMQTAYTSGVDAVTASDFDRAISGKETKWAENYRRKMAG